MEEMEVAERGEKMDKTEKAERSEKPEKAEKSAKSDKSLQRGGLKTKFSGLETKVPETLHKMRKSLFDYQMDWFRKKNTGLYHQRMFFFVKNSSRDVPESLRSKLGEAGDESTSLFSDEKSDDPDEKRIQPTPLFIAIRSLLIDAVKYCGELIYTKDQLAGIYLHMTDYGIFIVEGPESLLLFFSVEILKIFGNFWEKTRVFKIEDHIDHYYFSSFTCKMCPSVYINEKFPQDTENDVTLMGQQHRLILNKLKGICMCLAKDRNSSFEEEEAEELSSEYLAHKACEKVHSDAFKKLLPEVQRIDLVLNSKRFYPSISYVSDLHQNAKTGPDDDEQFWPLMDNMTPVNIFIKSKFDYNLTYPESNEAVKEEGQKHVLSENDEEEEGESEEGEGEGEAGEGSHPDSRSQDDAGQALF